MKMSLFLIFVCFSLVLIANVQTSQTSAQVKSENLEEMTAAKVFKDGEIPNIIDQLPEKFLSISYPESGVKVDSGNELTPTQVKSMPTIVWDAETPDTYYTLLMTDPDAPNRAEPTLREVRHWLVVNIKGNDLSSGTTHFEFIGSGPPKDSGLHRYVFLLFKQTGKLEFEEPTVTNRSRDFRLKSSTRELVAKYDLKLVAGNYYQAQFDDYVPLLHAQLSGN